MRGATMDPTGRITPLPDGHGPLKKYDGGKADLAILPGPSLEATAEVLMFGEEKYSRHNWRAPDFDFDRYVAAALRHIFAWNEGEDTDPETGLSHLAHASGCLMFLLWHERRGTGASKRYVPKEKL